MSETVRGKGGGLRSWVGSEADELAKAGAAEDEGAGAGESNTR